MENSHIKMTEVLVMPFRVKKVLLRVFNNLGKPTVETFTVSMRVFSQRIMTGDV